MPAMRTGVPSMKASATAPLGKVSVVAMAEAAKRQASGRRLSAVSGTSSVMRASSSTTPMTPVLASITSRLPTPSRLATAGGHPLGGPGAGLAGEGVGAAGVDHQGPHVASAAGAELGLAPVHGRRADPVAGEDPRTGRARRKAHDQHVVAVARVESGAGGGELDAGDRSDIGEVHRQGRAGQIGFHGKPLLGLAFRGAPVLGHLYTGAWPAAQRGVKAKSERTQA